MASQRLSLNTLARFINLLIVCGVALQLFFVARIALMRWIDPQSTTFERSEMTRLALEQHRIAWSQTWRPDAQLGDALKRAVIASEDAGFVDHNGVEWDALEKAWQRNQRAQARADAQQAQLEQRRARQIERARRAGRQAPPASAASVQSAKVVGGSTITQQLAKNLFLSGERNLVRKGQEFAITFMLETLLPKQRILEIYLNHVEWGEGVFGAQAASRHYFGADAHRLNATQAARLAVMLPAPKRFERNPGSAYVSARASTVVARMGAVELP